MTNKVDLSKVKDIWAQLHRFAEYNDLKKLHSIVIPEIAKFEQKIIESQTRFDQFEQMIKSFDEAIQMKSNKVTVD